jgi:hypothetical protein
LLTATVPDRNEKFLLYIRHSQKNIFDDAPKKWEQSKLLYFPIYIFSQQYPFGQGAITSFF